MEDAGHIPVLLEEVMDLLQPESGEVAVDCTTGQGGHAVELAKAVGHEGQVIGFDLDPANLEFAARRIDRTGTRFRTIRDNFVTISDHLNEMGLSADVVLADLGFSSSQMDDPERGFSFSTDGPLDMRMDPSGPMTAADLLSSLDEDEITDMIRRYGEDPLARKIARKLTQSREEEPIQTTAQLARLVREAYGSRALRSRMHPATRTFMALRIALNDELAALQSLMDQVTQGAEQAREGGWLRTGARIAVISFHSLEDRIVKRSFADLARRGLVTRLTRRPVICSPTEIVANPRSRSAKLRVVKVGAP